MPYRDDSAAFARNWRTILAVDLGLGLVALVAGVVWMSSSVAVGVLLSLVGVVYVFFAGGRIAKWRRLRRQAGL